MGGSAGNEGMTGCAWDRLIAAKALDASVDAAVVSEEIKFAGNTGASLNSKKKSRVS